MQPRDWVALFSLLATTGMAVFTIWFNYRNLLQQRQREDAIRADERSRVERETQVTRSHEPHVEFTIDAQFFGPVEGHWLAEVSLIAHNVGNVIQHFSRIHLRIRGIPEGRPLARWAGHGSRAEFPEKIVEENNIIPKTRDGKEILYFAEPGVRQTITYLTTIPLGTKFVLIFAEFDYHGKEGRTHDCERVFALESPANETPNPPAAVPSLMEASGLTKEPATVQSSTEPGKPTDETAIKPTAVPSSTEASEPTKEPATHAPSAQSSTEPGESISPPHETPP